MPQPSDTSQERLYKTGQEKRISSAEDTKKSQNNRKRKNYCGKFQELRDTLLTLKKQGTN